MDILKICKIHEKKIIIIGIAIFLTTRLTNLTLLPIFTDEAIYIRWSEIAMHANWSSILADRKNLPPNEKVITLPLIPNGPVIVNRQFNDARRDFFISLSDGKQPLFMWAAILPMMVTKDHLWAGRFIAVLAGLAACIGIWWLTYEIFKNKKIAYGAACAYLIMPFTLLYDRLALADAMLAMWGIYATWMNIKLIKNPTIKNAAILGIIYGCGLLTKSPALIYILLAPLAAIFAKKCMDENGKIQITAINIRTWTKETWRQIGKTIFVWLIAVMIGQIMQAFLRLSNMYHMIGKKNLEFIITFQEFFERPFALLYGNMVGMTTWLAEYIGTANIVACISAIAIGIYKKDARILYLLLLILIAWIATASFNKVLYPRYLLFFFPPVLMLIAYATYVIIKAIWLKQRASNMTKYLLSAIVVLSITVYPLYSSIMILVDPPKALIPLQDKEQFITGWPSGYGVNEIYNFLHQKYKEKGKIAVGTEGTFGLMPFALEIKFYSEIYDRKKSQNIYIKGYWPFDKIHQDIVELATERPTYFVVYQTEQEPPKEFPLELVMKINKPGNKTSMRLYKVTPVWRYTPEGVIKSE